MRKKCLSRKMLSVFMAVSMCISAFGADLTAYAADDVSGAWDEQTSDSGKLGILTLPYSVCRADDGSESEGFIAESIDDLVSGSFEVGSDEPGADTDQNVDTDGNEAEGGGEPDEKYENNGSRETGKSAGTDEDAAGGRKIEEELGRSVQKTASIADADTAIAHTDEGAGVSENSYVELNEDYDSSGISIQWHEEQDLVKIINEGQGAGKLTKKEAVYVLEKRAAHLYISGFADIDSHVFEGASGLKDVVIGDQLEKIGSWAFTDCPVLESISLPDTLDEIGAYAFYKCQSLYISKLPDSIRRIQTGAFWNCKSIVLENLPPALDKIEGCVFRGCSALRLKGLPSGIISIGDAAFAGCAQLALTELPSGIISIGTGAFDGCAGIALTGLPLGITKIGDSAFVGCVQLALTELPAGIEEIGMCTFQNCVSLKLAELPAGVSCIGNAAFRGCTLLGMLKLPAGLKRINAYAFAGCVQLELQELPAGLESIGREAFENCSQLSLESFPESLVEIGEFAFENCGSLKNVTICGRMTSLAEGIFSDCAGLESVCLPDTVREVGSRAFKMCRSLERINLPDGLQSVGSYAFQMDSALELTALPDSLAVIGSFAFSYCERMKVVSFPDSLESVDDHAFYNSSGVVVSSPNHAAVSEDEAVLTYYTVKYVTGTGSTDYHPSDVIGSKRCTGYYGKDISDVLASGVMAQPQVEGYLFTGYAVLEGNERIMLTNDDTETTIYAVFKPENVSTFTVSLPACVELDEFHMENAETAEGVFYGKIDYEVSYYLKDDLTVLSVCLLDCENGGDKNASYLQHGQMDSGSFTKETGGAVVCDAEKSCVAWTNGNVRSGAYAGAFRTEGRYGTAEFDSSTGMYKGCGTIAVTSRFDVKETGAYSGHATVVISSRQYGSAVLPGTL